MRYYKIMDGSSVTFASTNFPAVCGFFNHSRRLTERQLRVLTNDGDDRTDECLSLDDNAAFRGVVKAGGQRRNTDWRSYRERTGKRSA